MTQIFPSWSTVTHLMEPHVSDPDVPLVVYCEPVGQVEQVGPQAGLHLHYVTWPYTLCT